MSGGAGKRAAGRQRIVYCIVPRDLAEKLHDTLRRHFRDDPGMEVVVERRARRRRRGERRQDDGDLPARGDRRRVESAAGRRAGDRRVRTVQVGPPESLPRRVQRHADRLVFVERLEPAAAREEDEDTARLVARVQAGEGEAFSGVYTRYFDRVYGYLHVIFRNPHDAEEVTQEVFARAFEALPGYERREQPFAAWLFTVARNHAIKELRRMSRVEPMDPAELAELADEDGLAEPELEALNWISDRELLMFVERLPLPQRQALVMHHVFDLPNSRIAELLGRSQEDVRKLQSRAARFVRDRLTAIGRAPSDTDRGTDQQMRAPLRKSKVLRNRRHGLTWDARAKPPGPLGGR